MNGWTVRKGRGRSDKHSSFQNLFYVRLKKVCFIFLCVFVWQKLSLFTGMVLLIIRKEQMVWWCNVLVSDDKKDFFWFAQVRNTAENLRNYKCTGSMCWRVLLRL